MKNILFKFEAITENSREIKTIKSQFLKHGVGVVSFDQSSIKRANGISFKELTFGLNDSQSVSVRVKQSGDVYQVMVNGKVLPLKNQDDHEAAIKEIAGKVDGGRAAFQRKLAAVKIAIPAGIKSTAAQTESALTEKRDNLKAAIAAVDEEIAAVQTALANRASAPAIASGDDAEANMSASAEVWSASSEARYRDLMAARAALVENTAAGKFDYDTFKAYFSKYGTATRLSNEARKAEADAVLATMADMDEEIAAAIELGKADSTGNAMLRMIADQKRLPRGNQYKILKDAMSDAPKQTAMSKALAKLLFVKSDIMPKTIKAFEEGGLLGGSFGVKSFNRAVGAINEARAKPKYMQDPQFQQVLSDINDQMSQLESVFRKATRLGLDKDKSRNKDINLDMSAGLGTFLDFAIDGHESERLRAAIREESGEANERDAISKMDRLFQVKKHGTALDDASEDVDEDDYLYTFDDADDDEDVDDIDDADIEQASEKAEEKQEAEEDIAEAKAELKQAEKAAK